MSASRHNPARPWSEVPWAPSRWPFFYGWVLVAAAAFGTVASVPGQTIGVGVFTDSLTAVLGLSLSQLSLAYLIGTVASGSLLPVAGVLLDRWGTRSMVVLSSLGLALSLLVFTGIDHWVDPVESTGGTVVVTALCYAFLRFWGQGCLTLTCRTTVAKWFDHHRGLAVGLGNIPVAYCFNAAPALLNHWVQQLGWRSTYGLLAALTGLGMGTLGWLFFRDNPEQCGLRMDGVGHPNRLRTVLARWRRWGCGRWIDRLKLPPLSVPTTGTAMTRRQALGTAAFWVYTAVIAWQALLATAVTFQITAIGREAGLDSQQAYHSFVVIGLVTVVPAVLLGWLSDRMPLKALLVAMLLGQALAGGGLLGYSGEVGRGLFILGYSLAGALMGVLSGTVWARLYGRKHLGAISGAAMSIVVYATALGPYLFSRLQQATGSYRVVGWLCLLWPLALLGPAWVLRHPQPMDGTDTTR